MGTFPFFLGSLIPTFLLSRLFLWLMKTWDGGVRRLLLVHACSLLVAALLGGMGMADGGAFAGAAAAAVYAPGQLIWLLVDLWRTRCKAPKPDLQTNAQA